MNFPPMPNNSVYDRRIHLIPHIFRMIIKDVFPCNQSVSVLIEEVMGIAVRHLEGV